MKTLLFCCCGLSYYSAWAQQSTLTGVVSIFNSETRTGKRQYVANAQVEDAFKATTTVTDAQGGFKLAYVGLPAGRSVTFQVTRPGLQVVNSTDLNAVTDQHEVVRISMAPLDSINDYRRRIYLIGRTAAEQHLTKQLEATTKQLAGLKSKDAAATATTKQLQGEIATLTNQLKQLEEQAQHLALTYAPINLDDVSPLFRHAFQLFQQGRLDSAVQVLHEANLPNQVRAILAERSKVMALGRALAQRDSVQKERTRNASEALRLQADLYKTANQLEKADACYQSLLALDSANPKNLRTYAYFLAWTHHYVDAIDYYKRALVIYQRLAKDKAQVYEPDLAAIQNKIGWLYYKQHEFIKAEQVFLEALQIHQRLAKDNPQVHDSGLADIQNYLGMLYSKQNEFTKAEQVYSEALTIYQRLAKDNPQVHEPSLASTQVNLGVFYLRQHEFVKAEQAFLNALQIRQRLAKDNPQAYEPGLADVQINLGLLYSKQSEFTKAEQVYSKALIIYQLLAKKNPHVYEPSLATIQTNQGALYCEQHEFVKAEQAFLSALQIRQRLVKDNPQAYEPDLADIQNNLGIFYSRRHEFIKAAYFYSEALAINQRLAEENPQVYESSLAATQINQGILYYEQHEFAKAEQAYLRALAAYQYLSKKNPHSYESSISFLQTQLRAIATAKQ